MLSLTLCQLLLPSSFPNPQSHIRTYISCAVSFFILLFHFSLLIPPLLSISSSFFSSNTSLRGGPALSPHYPNALLSLSSPVGMDVFECTPHPPEAFVTDLCALLKRSRSLIHVSWVLWGLRGGGWGPVASWRPLMWLEPCLTHPAPWRRPSLSPQSSYVVSLWLPFFLFSLVSSALLASPDMPPSISAQPLPSV